MKIRFTEASNDDEVIAHYPIRRADAHLRCVAAFALAGDTSDDESRYIPRRART
jgi:hypothetical protein